MAEVSTPATGPPPPLQCIPPKASLYVGDLHPQVTETDLIQTFITIGPLISVRVCRARGSLKSLCYGYVNFFNPSDASKALASLNHTELKGKLMRIMWCERDPTGRKNGNANLFVKNLAPLVTSACLERMFGKYGTVLSCKVAEDNGKSKGFGFVQYESEDSAKAAVDALHGVMLQGKKLYVCKFVKKTERNSTSKESFTNLFVKNLDEDISEDILRERFSKYGKISNVMIVKDNGGKSKGFGFVEFNSNEEASKAMECMDGALLGSKKLFVQRAQKKEEKAKILKHGHQIAVSNNPEKLKASKLSVKNLSVTVDDRKLEEIFRPYGKVTSAKVMRDRNGISKGSGLVYFSNPEEAKRAKDYLTGFTVEGMSLIVDFAQSEQGSYQQYPSCSVYNEQSSCLTSWDALVPPYPPLYFDIPSYPSSVYMQPFYAVNFSNHAGGHYPSELRNPSMKFSTWVIDHLTTSSAYVSSPDKTFGAWKQHKSSSKFKNRSTYVPVERSTRKPDSVPCAVTALSEEKRKERITQMLQSYLKNIQVGHGESTSCFPLHTGKCGE